MCATRKMKQNYPLTFYDEETTGHLLLHVHITTVAQQDHKIKCNVLVEIQ